MRTKSLRILVTGSTRQHCGAPHQLNTVLTPHLVVTALRSAGHEVDQRPVVPGEKLRRHYDQAIIFLCSPEAKNAHHLYGASYAMLEFPDAIVAFDDWNIANAFTSIRRVVREPSNLARVERIFRRDNPLEVKPYLGRMIERLAELAEGRRYRIALSLFPWGDRKLLPLPNPTQLREYDPSPLVVSLYPQSKHRSDRAREKCWVFATVGDHVRWLAAQRLTWPVECYGVRRLGQPRIQESEVVRRYGEIEGTLAFRSRISGSGWFRLRFIQAAAMGCLLAGDLSDTASIGTPYRYRPAEIERLSPSDRRQLAREQTKVFMSRIGTEKDLVCRLNQILQE